MEIDLIYWYFILAIFALGCVFYAVLLARVVPGLWMTSARFNSTGDWVPASWRRSTPEPRATCYEGSLEIITSQLAEGETLEGSARGFFSPPRPRDWGPRVGIQKYPLLIAVTPRRIVLFELTLRHTLARTCSIRYDAIQYLRPPKARLLGNSGRLAIGLVSGSEYQMGFLGPVLHEEAMRQEQRLAAYLRWIAPRLPSSRAPRALTSPSTT